MIDANNTFREGDVFYLAVETSSFLCSSFCLESIGKVPPSYQTGRQSTYIGKINAMLEIIQQF